MSGVTIVAAGFRPLTESEIKLLSGRGNVCAHWQDILVADPFFPAFITNTVFDGPVRIGKLAPGSAGSQPQMLEHHGLRLPAGISNSRITACVIGDNCAIHNVSYLARYTLGNNVILFNIGEMHAGPKEQSGSLIQLNLINETGGRSIPVFNGILPADACLMAKFRGDRPLLEKLNQIPKNLNSGMVGSGTVIKHTRVIRDVVIGDSCCISGANRLENLTINSSADEPTRIGSGVELANGIVGHHSRILSGSRAEHFVSGRNTVLEQGARFIHSLLGDNSTVAGAEIQNSLIFPAHEQHHTNSFLIAALVMGQSNLAAGATIGSNHNSRSNDGEIQAGRGFWPGLCTSLKYSCRFASFTLLAKAAFPAELDIPLPFSLVSNDESRNRLEIMPAFWWLYNMYALVRNPAKFRGRDQRVGKIQHIEFDYLAPDTVEEIFNALALLELWTGKAVRRADGINPETEAADTLRDIGRAALLDSKTRTANLAILGENLEHSDRGVLIVKARDAYHAYKQMIHYYAVTNLVQYLKDNPGSTTATMKPALSGERCRQWFNLGGQLVREPDLRSLADQIKNGTLTSWEQIHQAYDALWQSYPLDKQRHAYASLLAITGREDLSASQWQTELDTAVTTQEYIRDRVYQSRKKDYANSFRQTTFLNPEEMNAVVGTAEDNAFVKQVKQETVTFAQLAAEIKKRG